MATFNPQDHAFVLTGPIEFARGLLGAECSCSNPDGEGVGYVSFNDYSEFELFSAWLDHYDHMKNKED